MATGHTVRNGGQPEKDCQTDCRIRDAPTVGRARPSTLPARLVHREAGTASPSSRDTVEEPASDGARGTTTPCNNQQSINFSNAEHCPILIGENITGNIFNIIRYTSKEHEKMTATESQCSKHKGEAMRFYCETCRCLICRDCTVVDHCRPDHNNVDIHDVALRCKQSLQDRFQVLDEKINERTETLEKAAKANQNNAFSTAQEVRDAAAEDIARVKADEKRLLDEIATQERDRSRELNDEQKTVSEMQRDLKKAQYLTSAGTDSYLASLHYFMRDDLKLPNNSPKLPEANYACSSLRFTQTHRRVGDFVLGEVKVEDNYHWELNAEIGKENDIRFQGSMDVTFLPAGQIAVADVNKKQVGVFSTTGNQESIIQMTKAPGQVDAIDTQIIVRDSTTWLKVYKDGELAFPFPTVERNYTNISVSLRGLVVKKDVILVGDIERMVLTEHRCNGSLIRTIPVKTEPRYLAVNSNGRVVISKGKQSVVEVTDDNGATRFTIQPTINDRQVQYCKGVCCDGPDIYVAVCENALNTGHIHRYNGEGKFLSCIIKGLYNPYGISFSADGQIAVADWQSVKIYHKTNTD